MAPFLKYTVQRLALFVGALGIFVALRATGVLKVPIGLAIIGAAAISFAVSYVFLYRQRQEVAEVIASRMERRLAERGPSGAEEDAAVEDAADEAARTDG